MIINKIEYVVCDYTGIAIEDLQLKSKKRTISFSRQLIWYFSSLFTRRSLSEMGADYNKDHATALYGIRNINNLIETDKTIRNDVKDLEKRIKKLEDVFNDAFNERKKDIEIQLFHNCI